MAVEIKHDQEEVQEKKTRKKAPVKPVETVEDDFTVVGATQVVQAQEVYAEPDNYDFLLPEGVNFIRVNRYTEPIWVGKSGKIRVPKENKELLEMLASIAGCRRLN